MKRLFLVFLIALITLSLFSCSVPKEDLNTDSTQTNIPTNTSIQSASVTGELAELKSETLDGAAFSADIFAENKLTLINVWATWCQPCIAELPYLEKLRNEYADKGVNVVGVLFDSGDEDAILQANSILQEKGITYTQLVVSDSVKTFLIDSYDIQSLPTTFFVDSNGDIVKQEVGSNSYEGWRSTVDGILG